MGLNKSKGNMYPWVTHTWNVIKGKCPHDCEYCYMKRFPQKKIRLDQTELKTDLGSDNTIFVGSSCDMWSWAVPREWILRVLKCCKKYPNNTYLFQTKNPCRFIKFYGEYPGKHILGTTIESNRHKMVEKHSEAPPTYERYCGMQEIVKGGGARAMVSIEPIMDFDLKEFLSWFYDIEPEFVSIGADSKGHALPEPSSIKVKQLIKALKEITEVKVKDNLNRLL